MKVKRTVTKTVEKEIDRCFYTCPYFSVEGQEGMMTCEHSQAPNPYIISHPDCMNGFPKRCPLTKKD